MSEFDIDGCVADLLEEAGHPDDDSAAAGVTHLQTHISHLFFTGDRVYKLRKPTRLPFLDFAQIDARNSDCLRELALNRRLSPEVYLGVAPILVDEGGHHRIGPVGEALAEPGPDGRAMEHVVVMKRLPDGGDALGLLERGALEPRHIDAVAARIADFHAQQGLGVPAPWSEADWWARIETPMHDTFELARSVGRPVFEPARLQSLEARMRARRQAHREAHMQRRTDGRAVDGHGDLHLQHVWFQGEQAPPAVIDCIEFDAELRRTDLAAELAFFAMDLAYRGRRDLAERFLRKYAERTDDHHLYRVIDDYIAHRGLIRGAVAGVATTEEELSEAQREAATQSARSHIDFVDRYVDRSSEAAVILTCGVVGAGKSTVAEALADTLHAAVVSSDRTRKHLLGLAPGERANAAPGQGAYTDEARSRVYEALLERAEHVLDSGRMVILDAAYPKRVWREQARSFAEKRGVPCLLVEVRCAREVALERLALRLEDPERVSDAGPELLDASIADFETTAHWPEAMRIEVATDRDDWRDGSEQRVRSALASS